MEISQIRYAAMVARYSNFSKAAETLFVTQPTLSQQIHKLEEELGFSLFQRTTRTVTVTDKGKIFFQHAEPLLRSYEALIYEVEKLKDSSVSSFQVGVLPTFSHLNILDTIDRFQSQHQEISVNLQIFRSNALLEKLMNDQLDIIIANIFAEQLHDAEEDNNIQIISQDKIHVVVHEKNPLAKKEELRMEDLNDRDVIMLSKESSIRKHMDAAFKRGGIRPHITYECPAIHSMIGMLMSDRGVGFLSSKVARQYASPPIISLPLVPDIGTMTAIIFRKKNYKAKELREFSDLIWQSIKAE